MEVIFSEIPGDSRRDSVLHYAKTTYGTTPEQLWRSHPNFLVLRHKSNQKWYGLIMDVEREKLHLPDDPYREDYIDILNLKCDPNLAGSLMANPGILPAYHMNKANWISVLLDGSAAEEQIFSLLDLSFDLTAGKKAGGRSRSGSRTWVIPANPRYYDLEEAFGESDIITWKQGRGIEAGDTVLIYMAAPVSSILYMCHVLETDIPYSFDDGKVRMDHIMRLKLQQRFPADVLTRETLRECDITAVRSPRYATDSLLREVSTSVSNSAAIIATSLPWEAFLRARSRRASSLPCA